MSFPLLRPLLCMHPVAIGIAVGLVAALIIHCVIAAITHRRRYWSVVLAYASLFLLALGLGSYLVSPLGFSSGRIPLLRGFLITRSTASHSLLHPVRLSRWVTARSSKSSRMCLQGRSTAYGHPRTAAPSRIRQTAIRPTLLAEGLSMMC